MNEKIDVFDPVIIFALIAAALGDFSFLFAIGIVIPAVGLVLAAAFVLAHYFCGIIAAAILWHKMKGPLAKIVLFLSILLPLPLLCIGIALAILLSNKLIAFLATTAAVQVLAVATAGAGEVAEIGVVAEAGAEGAAVVAEGAGEAAAVGEGTGASIAGGAETTGEAASEIDADIEPGAFGESAEAMDELQERLTGENPVGEEEFGPPNDEFEEGETDKKSDMEKEKEARAEKIEKLKKLMDKLPQGQDQPTDQDEDDNDLAAAA